MYNYEVLLDAWVGTQRGLLDMGICNLPRGCVLVNFTVFGMICSNFVGRLYSGGSWVGSSSVSMNRRWIDIP